MTSQLEPLHRFHSFCARFPSDIAERAIKELTSPGDSVLDPFCGSGTSLVAGVALGRSVIGGDVDVLAGMLSEVKCGPMAPSTYSDWRGQFVAEVDRRFRIIEEEWPPTLPPSAGKVWRIGGLELELPNFPRLKYWFPPQLSAFLAAISDAARQSGRRHFEQVALLSLSASIIAKWPNTLSYAMDIDHTRPHKRMRQFRRRQVFEAYIGRLDRSVRSLGQLHRAYEEAGVLNQLPERSEVHCPQDARRIGEKVPEGTQALVVTSPPYLDAVDYPRAHRLSVCWMNGHAPQALSDRRPYIGLHQNLGLDHSAWIESRPEVRRLIPPPLLDTSRGRRIIGYFSDLECVVANVKQVLRPGGHAVVVIGDNRIRGEVLRSHEALIAMAGYAGLHPLKNTARPIQSVSRRFPVGPFGFDGPMTHERVLVFRKPAAPA